MSHPPRWIRLAGPAGGLVGVVIVLLAVPTVPTPGPGAGSGITRPGESAAPAGVTPAAGPGTVGIAESGIVCAPGVRQVSWSAYAPECVPRWRGDNGGASAKGVTRATISVTYRLASTTSLQEIYTFFPPNMVGTNDEALSTLRAYIKLFNKEFELYGRQVVLKSFSGYGNFVSELTGTGQETAQADAVTEDSMETFADVSLADTSQVYVNDLAAQRIISFSAWPTYPLWYEGSRPYVYSTGADCGKRSAAAAALVGQELNGRTAQFAGGSLSTEVRRIGYVYQATPYEEACQSLFASDVSRYRPAPVEFSAYSFNFASLVQQASTILGKFASEGVTTVVLPSDPISPVYFMDAAQAMGYEPEWVLLPFFSNGAMDGDPLGALPALPQDEMAHAFTVGVEDGPFADSEAYKAFVYGCSLPPASDCSDPLPPFSLAGAYSTVLLLYSSLQAAGPWLTPDTFAQGLDTLPGGPAAGMFGRWGFGPGTVDPPAGFQVLKWEPNTLSPVDSAAISGTTIQPVNGGKGYFAACNRGEQYSYVDPVLPEGQPECPTS